MIVDFHTHFYPDHLVERAVTETAQRFHFVPFSDGSRAGLIRTMQKAGIDLAVGLPIVTRPGYGVSLNTWAKSVDGGPIVMLGSIHPRSPNIPEVLALIREKQLPGLKVHPEYQDFRFSERALDPVWEQVEAAGLFLLTHTGWDMAFPAPFRTNPAELRAFHLRFPHLTLILAHFGSLGMWKEVEELLIGLPVYFDLAFVMELPDADLKRMILRHGPERILFGSDCPWADPAAAIARIRSLKLGQEAEDLIFYRNALRLLKKRSA